MAGLPELGPSDDGALADWRALEALEILGIVGHSPDEALTERHPVMLGVVLNACIRLSEDPPELLAWAIEAQTSTSLAELNRGLEELTGNAPPALADTRAIQIAGLTLPVQLSLERQGRLSAIPAEVVVAIHDWCGARAHERGETLEQTLRLLAGDLLHLADRQHQQVGYVLLLALLALPEGISPGQTLEQALARIFPAPPHSEAP